MEGAEVPRRALYLRRGSGAHQLPARPRLGHALPALRRGPHHRPDHLLEARQDVSAVGSQLRARGAALLAHRLEAAADRARRLALRDGAHQPPLPDRLRELVPVAGSRLGGPCRAYPPGRARRDGDGVRPALLPAQRTLDGFPLRRALRRLLRGGAVLDPSLRRLHGAIALVADPVGAAPPGRITRTESPPHTAVAKAETSSDGPPSCQRSKRPVCPRSAS